MTWSIAFCIACPGAKLGGPDLPLMRLNRRWHHMAEYRHDQAWHWRLRAAVGTGAPAEPLERAKVELIRYSIVKKIDPDGITASWKPVIDGLRHAKVLAEDSTENIELISLHQRVEHRRDQQVGVSVMELQHKEGGR